MTYDASEWKPGDVAVIGWNMTSGTERAIRQHKAWETESGIHVQDVRVESARRLVVIDAEVAEDVARLLHIMRPGAMGGLFSLQDALREFARPTPRIEEPTGLGAVVEDGEGKRWIHDGRKGNADNWFRADLPGCRTFADLNAVSILSPGVTS